MFSKLGLDEVYFFFSYHLNLMSILCFSLNLLKNNVI